MDNVTSGGEAPDLIISNSFNGRLSRMAALDHTGILVSGRKILKQAKKQQIEPTMRMSEVIQMTVMTKEDLEILISCRLITVAESADDPVLSFRDVYGLMRIFTRFVDQGIMP